MTNQVKLRKSATMMMAVGGLIAVQAPTTPASAQAAPMAGCHAKCGAKRSAKMAGCHAKMGGCHAKCGAMHKRHHRRHHPSK